MMKVCSNCPFMELFPEVKKDSENALITCRRLRAEALKQNVLFLCRPFNYGFGVQPQKPEPMKYANQTTL